MCQAYTEVTKHKKSNSDLGDLKIKPLRIQLSCLVEKLIESYIWENKHWYSGLGDVKIKPLRFTRLARNFSTSWTTSSSWPTSRPTSRPRRNMWVNLLHKAQSQLLDPSLFCLFTKCRHVVVTLWFLFLFHTQSSSCPHKRKVSEPDIP